jgi:hypothetical protein
MGNDTVFAIASGAGGRDRIVPEPSDAEALALHSVNPLQLKLSCEPLNCFYRVSPVVFFHLDTVAADRLFACTET